MLLYEYLEKFEKQLEGVSKSIRVLKGLSQVEIHHMKNLRTKEFPILPSNN